jgi:hypothetical protein
MDKEGRKQMSGDELLADFLAWVEKERPERFFPKEYAGEDKSKNYWCGKYVDDPTWKIVVAKEACYGAYDAVLFRKHKGLTKEIIPVEVKADSDVLDDRLRAQIWVHIKNFQKSMLVLGKEQGYKVKKLKLHKMLPTEIWIFNGVGFEQLTESIYKFHHHGYPEISHRAIGRAFRTQDTKTIHELSHRLWQIRAVVATLTANQWRYGEEEKFTQEEAKIAQEIFGYPLHPTVCEPPKELDVSNVETTGFSSKVLQKTLLEVPFNSQQTKREKL